MQMRVADETNVPEGSLALPESIRKRMGLRAGDLLDVSFDASAKSERIVLTLPQVEKKYAVKIIADPVTGWPVMTAGPGAPKLTSEEVAEILAEFP